MAQFIYADESGISAKERVVVVAAVIIDADKQWKAVESYVSELISEYVPEDHQTDFAFHATDLFHGSGKVFDRRKYPRGRSREALRKLIGIPNRFKLPLAWGFLAKQPKTLVSKLRPRDQAGYWQAFAFALAVISAERFMQKYTAGEIATLVAENNTDTYKTIKRMHGLLRGRAGKELGGPVTFQLLSQFGHLPLQQVVDSVHFADKSDAPLMQIADACALILRYYAEQKPNCEDLFDAISGGDRSDWPPISDLSTRPAGLRLLHWRENE